MESRHCGQDKSCIQTIRQKNILRKLLQFVRSGFVVLPCIVLLYKSVIYKLDCIKCFGSQKNTLVFTFKGLSRFLKKCKNFDEI